MYGGITKTKKMVECDNRFVERVIKSEGSRQKATSHCLKLAWHYLDKNDLKTAMKRFNQAWLLTSDNYQIFWGFGIILARQAKIEDALKMFKKAISINHTNARLLSDLGYTCFVKAYNDSNRAEKETYFKRSIRLYERAVKIDPNIGQIYSQWANTLFYMGNYQAAWDKIQVAQAKGATINPKILKELKKNKSK